MGSHIPVPGLRPPWWFFSGYMLHWACCPAVLYTWFYGPLSMATYPILTSKQMWLNQEFRSFPIHTMTPVWIFPAYPLLLIGPFAANLIDALPDAASAARINSVAITFGALTLQGTAFMVSLMIYSAFIYRLMTQKLPRETTRPGIVCLMFNFLSYCLRIKVCFSRT